MPPVAITTVEAQSARPKEKPYRLYDTEGLYLEVMPNGSKYWRLKYRFAGKEKRLAPGVFPKVSVKKAHKERQDAKDLLDHGIDPGETRSADKRNRQFKAANSFEVVAREWHDQQKPGWTADHAARVLLSMEQDL